VSEPLRPGDVWLADLNPVIGSEQAGRRPVVIVSGPLHLALTINGRPEPMETISSANTDFIFSYDIPPDFIGQPKMEIALNVDRATTVLGDQRLLGLAFGTFAIR